MFDSDRLSKLLVQAQGKRSLNELARQSSLSNSYISILIAQKRTKTPPSADVLRRIACAAEGRVTYIELMIAAGHLTARELNEYYRLVWDVPKTEYNAVL